MRYLWVLALYGLLVGCAASGSTVDQARNDNDLGVLQNAKLALASQVATDSKNLHAIVQSTNVERVP